jgi:hypothetical protein
MVAARWRIRRMWTIETNLFNVEILTQQSKTDTPDVGIHLAMAYRSLADDSRSLALASRYEARLQRLYDHAYKTLRELQQARKSEPPAQPHTIEVRWVDSQEELDRRAAANRHSPSVSEGAGEESNPPVAADFTPAPEPELPNEPTPAAKKAAKKEVSDDPANANSEEFYNLREDLPTGTRNPIEDAPPAVPFGESKEELE